MVPLDAWENNTPVLDAIIRETLRVAQPHAAMRRNMGGEIIIEGKVVPTGAYVLYPFSDVHLDPELCMSISYDPKLGWTSCADPDPWRFDPGRTCETKAAYSYIGWGAGTSYEPRIMFTSS